jgi:pimeloyl-ACP methyl ester carboxylesterase
VIVFVHGVPETAAIWRKVRAAIGRESVALSMPGFGCPRPEGFTATKDDYAAWLIGELEALDGPIDLVGHDWGAGLTYRVASRDGELLRSWAADVGNIVHPSYEWHAFAKVWQAPGDGEAFVQGQNDLPPGERAAGLESMGISHEDALELATGSDATMGQCILDLYRSALPNIHADWGPWAPTSAPGLVIHPTEDPFSDEALAPEVADALGARFARIEGAGHFWPYQAPEKGVAILEEFWAELG